ncbi:hypothetical protein [Sphingomonas sp. 3-13AW]|uniref:hypothetical protein n=1 Tax=Sphingomonas sp. 3-13AW TaxID=3050450 RepID=UPI003BB66F16
MDATIHYADAAEAAVTRSRALRWLLDWDVLGEQSMSRQFHLTQDALEAVRDGAPLLVTTERAVQIDRMVATQSLLSDGYTPAKMAQWFKAGIVPLDGRSSVELLSSDTDGTTEVLAAAHTWMG